MNNDNKYYYELQMQPIFDQLYLRSTQKNNFNKLMKHIININNILLAYYNIKSKNDPIFTKEQLNIQFIKYINSLNKTSKIVKTFYINQYNGKQQLISKSAFWDKLIQQAIKQVLEPICEAKFNNNSYGFRRGRSYENALASISSMINIMHNYYAIDINIIDFYKNVNHRKLMRQLWSLGIHDKKLLYIINCILHTSLDIINYNSNTGIIQSGLLLPLLTNIVLNELDHRLSHMWCEHPIVYNCGKIKDRGDKGIDKGHAYELMRKTKLKELRFVRYAHEIKIITTNYNNAQLIGYGIVSWIKCRLHLNANFTIIKLQQRNLYFNGFMLKAINMGLRHKQKKMIPKFIIKTKLTQDVQKSILKRLKKQLIKIQHAPLKQKWKEINQFNKYVLKIHLYYRIATAIVQSLHKINWIISIIIYNRFGSKNSTLVSEYRLKSSKITNDMTQCRTLLPIENKLYKQSKQLICFKQTKQPIYPIGYIQFKTPMHIKRNVSFYTEYGRQLIYNKQLYMKIQYLQFCMEHQDLYNKSIEYANNRIIKFSQQKGKCAILNIEFNSLNDIHCHHIIPKCFGGTNDLNNLILIYPIIHKLIHAVNKQIINKYLLQLNLSDKQLKLINKLRKVLKLSIIQ